MAGKSTSKPTTAPPRATLVIAPIPAPPPGLTTEETERWNRLHHFRNTVDAIRDHLQPPGTQRAYLMTLTWLYYNQHVAGPGEQYTNEFSLRSRLSKDKRTEDNLNLATIGAGPETKEDEAKERWNGYLSELGLPEGERVGTGLQDDLRCRDPWAARILVSMSSAAATPMVMAAPLVPTTVAETAGAGAGAVTSGEAGSSTVAFEATGRGNETTSPVGHEEAATRLASVEEAINGATEESDEDLFLALQSPHTPVPRRSYESNDEAMTRLAVQFMGSQPFATARDALIELVRAAWDVEAAINNWSPDQAEEGHRDDEGQPPSKRQHLNNDDDDGEEEEGERGKGKGKPRAD